MPETDRPEYNPLIMGFVKDCGPLVISLKEARATFGRLPSDYHLVPTKRGRKLKQALNLDLGRIITARLAVGRENLKKAVIDFFNGWHRSYEDEFGVSMAPFLNLNGPARVRTALARNQDTLVRLSKLDIRHELRHVDLIRKDVLNSIPDDRLSETVIQMLARKERRMSQSDRVATIRGTLSDVRAHTILQSLHQRIGPIEAGFPRNTVDIYADEIADALHQMSIQLTMEGIGGLQWVQGRGVEFQFAPRDGSYLALGKQTGDCTADKPLFQADQDVENIYWTVFPWILDRNYQILKVFFNGDFIMKAHILPLFWITAQDARMILAVDAIETARTLRDDLEGHCREDLFAHRSRILTAVLAQIRSIAAKMGIADVYAERFSNTPWVRSELSQLPEILINVHQLIKLDELEDVYELARNLSRESGYDEVRHVFMELQMKNTSLLPGVTRRMAGIKSFSIVQGNPKDGIPIKRVVGI